MSFLEYTDIFNFDFPYVEKYTHEGIYHCFREPPILTVVSGARCSDGIVLIADRKISTVYGRELRFEDKIRGDLAHILIGYAGRVSMFDIFRKYVVGDVLIRRSKDPYTPENFITESAHSVKRFNELVYNPDFFFEVLVAKHQWKNSELYHIDFSGKHKEVKYKAIGSGEETANKFCAGLSHEEVTMKDFLKHAYFAIEFMDQYHPELKVGIEPDGIPDIKYLYYNQEWDKEPPKQDIDDCKKYSKEKLEQFRQAFEKIVKE